MALSETCRTWVWLRQLCQELQVTQKPEMIFQDDVGSISGAEGGSAKYFARRKRIDVRHQYISEIVDNHEIVLAQVPTSGMKADFLTKPSGP